MAGFYGYYDFPQYISVAQRKVQAEIRRAFFDGNLEAGPARGEYVTNRKSLAWLQATCKR